MEAFRRRRCYLWRMVEIRRAEPSGFSGTAYLMADPARALMLSALLDGRALPAGELACAAGITAQTASSHLAKLLTGGLVTVETQGRHRYYRLAGAPVAQALEQLAAIRPGSAVAPRALSPEARRLRFCRSCYDHVAGQVGVAIARALETRAFLVPSGERQLALTAAGAAWIASLGVDPKGLPSSSRRGIARRCLDWTERRYHLAGPLGVALLRELCARGWLQRMPGSRAIEVSATGRRQLDAQLGIELDTPPPAPPDQRVSQPRERTVATA
jgi:DNA-binding transcriptional ArsR family regulator